MSGIGAAANYTSSLTYNTRLYGSFKQEVERAVATPESFAIFKSTSFPRIHLTFFQQTDAPTFGTRFIDCLAAGSPHLLRALPELARADVSIGSPTVVRTYQLPPPLSTSVTSSPLMVRYIMELALLEKLFPSVFSEPGSVLLEIGGGFGGFATVVSHIHRKLGQYLIVDLDVVGQLQRMYVKRVESALCSVHNRTATRKTNTRTTPSTSASLPLKTISSEQPLADVRSDLLFSFFSISEQLSHVADAYINHYVRHAKRGYLQLNFDEGECGASTRQAKNVNRHSAWDLFRHVYRVQPSAILLPPPPCGAASSTSQGGHRIVWGLEETRRSWHFF